jgi:hypothetical protein
MLTPVLNRNKEINLKKKRPANLNNTRSKRLFPFEFICSIVLFFWPNRKKKELEKKKKKRKKIITNNINKKYDKERFCVCMRQNIDKFGFSLFSLFEYIEIYTYKKRGSNIRE